jgi:adenosylcobinamide kinase/adenosylcobinamide-phosphate guanylyltransferase
MFEKGSGVHEKMPTEEAASCVTEDILRLKDRVGNLIVVTNEFETEEGFDEDTGRYLEAVNRINSVLIKESDKVYDIRDGIWKIYGND